MPEQAPANPATPVPCRLHTGQRYTDSQLQAIVDAFASRYPDGLEEVGFAQLVTSGARPPNQTRALCNQTTRYPDRLEAVGFAKLVQSGARLPNETRALF